MILSGEEIIKNKEIDINPTPCEEAIQPASIDLHLSKYVTVLPRNVVIDVHERYPPVHLLIIPQDGIELKPGDFVLLRTLETVTISNNYCALCEGRSSIGRLGLTIHVTAGFTDPGYKGTLTLECKNLSDTTIKLYAGMRICQLIVMEVKNNSKNYNGKYQYGVDPEPSKINQDKENIQE